MHTDRLHPTTLADAEKSFADFHASPRRAAMRAAAFTFSAPVVYTGDRDCDLSAADVLHRELPRIKALGFSAVRFHVAPVERTPGDYDTTVVDACFAAAAAHGLGVLPHLHLTRPSDAALAKHGVTRADLHRAGTSDPRVRAAIAERLVPLVRRFAGHPALVAWPHDGEPSPTPIPLADDADRAAFAAWLATRYASPAAVEAAWVLYRRRDLPTLKTWDDAVALAGQVLPGQSINGTAHAALCYGAVMELLRWRTACRVRDMQAETDAIRAIDPVHPILPGNHQLFINEASMAWDLAAMGRTGDGHFTSIHPSWHFEQVDGEVDFPVYLQAKLTADAVGDGFASAYETTGGPVMHSGGYGNHMDAGFMRRLCCAYLAGGCRGLGWWTWNARPGGWEGGEYGMLGRASKPTPWAVEAGRISAALTRWQDELWACADERGVAILRSWDTQAVLALEPPRHDLRRDGLGPYSSGPSQEHLYALIGATRALTNARVPFTIIDQHQLVAGCAPRWPVLYLPHVRSVDGALLTRLAAYVEAGGRLIADVAVAFTDHHGKQAAAGPGSATTAIFGAWIDSLHDARTTTRTVDGLPVVGYHGDLHIDAAAADRVRVIRRFDDGRPAATECRHGRGTATLVAVDLARQCHRPGQATAEAMLADVCRGDEAPGWTTDAALAFRRLGPTADHYWLLNPGPARTAILRVHDRRYVAGCDAIDGTAVEVGGTIAVPLPRGGAVWLRFARAE